MNPMLLRRARKIIVAEGDGTLPLPVAATLQKNLEALGFVMSQALFERVRTLAPAQADALYRKLVAQLKRMVGAHREFRPLYPNFPDQVMRLGDAELYLNALHHYWGLADGFGEKTARPPLAEAQVRAQTLRTIDLGTTADADALFVALAAVGRTLASGRLRHTVSECVARLRSAAQWVPHAGVRQSGRSSARTRRCRCGGVAAAATSRRARAQA